MYKQRVISLSLTLLNVRLVFLFTAFVHLAVTAIVTLNIDTTIDEDPKVRAYYFVRWKLITCWFNLVSLVYLLLRLYADWKRSQGEGCKALVKQLDHASDVLMTGLLFPIVLYSDGLFWLMYNKNPALLGPPRIFEYLPNWAQHSLHTVSFFVVIIDVVLTPRRRPKSLKPRLALLLAFSFTYTFMIFLNFSRGEMVYQVFEDMDSVQLALSAAASVAVILILFGVQWVLIDYLWGSQQLRKKILR